MKVIKKSVIFLNDSEHLNARYRSDLMRKMEATGWQVSNHGLLLGRFLSFGTLFKLLFCFKGMVISSNLRANLFFLAVPWACGLVILNGLGRYRRSKRLRTALLLFLKITTNKVLAIQSYADFRYLRRFSKCVNLRWIPGSGGSVKAIQKSDNLFCVQRDDKISLVTPSIRHLLATLPGRPSLVVVGCQVTEALSDLFEDIEVEFTGYVSPEKILSYGGIFVQPSGYGEGFPHSLADAIVSGLSCIIAEAEYRRYGLKYLGAHGKFICPGWYLIEPGLQLRKSVSLSTITKRYLDCIDEMLAS